ncbi:Pimeloyl-ACP methyl ester carboxylesterase [Paenibacillus sp. UNC496MF]|uniref:alpha/beta hydrolase n=1 Tax=Paenibacillus sp. UNC496MF TaxID=1502753 RepID=UPI0008F12BAF|nr:alpha/beta hydrolase [Paenibacillus sp. UNC496MF]SFJ83732.1 Pimeloyl-ACP methyl ester carboxylesterase [Paenibacillus sp. UNC496MF]
MTSQEMRRNEDIGFLFVSGAGLRGSIWTEVTDGLEAPALAADYPLRDGPAAERLRLGLADYAAHVRKQAEAWRVRRMVVVAHSIGGVAALPAAAALAERGRLAGLAAVGAAIPREGGSWLSALPMPKRAVASALMRLFGTKPPAAAIRAGLCDGLGEAQTEAVASGFVPEARRLYTEPCRAAVPPVPSVYIKLTRDKEFDPRLQDRMIANLSPGRVAALEAGHLPMLSDPEGLRAILNSFRAELAEAEL